MTIINFPGVAEGGDDSKRLVERAVELKRRLVAFALEGPLRSSLDEVAEGDSLEAPFTTEAIEAIDWFLFAWESPDGLLALDAFLDSTTDLTPDDRSILEGWFESFDDIFEVVRILPDSIVARDEDDEEYVIVPTAVSATDLPWDPGTFVGTRLLPLGDVYLLSGIQEYAKTREELIAPGGADAINAAEELLDVIRGVLAGSFVEFFGVDELEIDASEIIPRLESFREFAFEKYRVEGVGRTLGDLMREVFGEMPPVEFMFEGLRPEDVKGRRITLFADPVEGIVAAPGYDNLKRYVERGEGDLEALRDVVLDLLESETVPPAVFRKLAYIDRARLGRLLADALDDPKFDMDADFDELLAEYKPELEMRDAPGAEEAFEDGDGWSDEHEAAYYDENELGLDEGVVTPYDIEDVRLVRSHQHPAGALVDVARAYLAGREDSDTSGELELRAMGVNLLVWYLGEQGIETVEGIDGDTLEHFAGVWYTRVWSERSPTDVVEMLAMLEDFVGWLARARGWTDPSKFAETSFPRLKTELPRTVTATYRLADVAWGAFDEELGELDGLRPDRGGEDTLAGIFAVTRVEADGVRVEQTEAEAGYSTHVGEIRLALPADAAALLREGDQLEVMFDLVAKTWELADITGVYPAGVDASLFRA